MFRYGGGSDVAAYKQAYFSVTVRPVVNCHAMACMILHVYDTMGYTSKSLRSVCLWICRHEFYTIRNNNVNSEHLLS